MVTLSPASVVVIPFPFSDLSGTKLRPAVVLAETGNDDWLLFARPMKLFTANIDLIVKRVAILNDETFKAILTITIESLRKNLPK